MRLRTIWTMPALDLHERWDRTKTWAAMKIAGMLPVRIRYWVTVREIGKATLNSFDAPATPLREIMYNLEAPKGMS